METGMKDFRAGLLEYLEAIYDPGSGEAFADKRFLEDLDMDSLDRLEVLIDCEAYAGLYIDETSDDFIKTRTPGELADFVTKIKYPNA